MKVIIALLIGYALFMNLQQPITNKIDVPIVAAKAQEIDSAAIIKTLKNKAQIVGAEGTLTKTHTYQDSLFQTNTLFDRLGHRQFTAEFTAIFKIGIDAEQIKIHCKNGTVYVMLPEPILISMEVGNVNFQNDTGLLRVQLTDGEKLKMLSRATDTARIEVMVDSHKVKALEGIKSIIDSLIKPIPGVMKVEYL